MEWKTGLPDNLPFIFQHNERSSPGTMILNFYHLYSDNYKTNRTNYKQTNKKIEQTPTSTTNNRTNFLHYYKEQTPTTTTGIEQTLTIKLPDST